MPENDEPNLIAGLRARIYASTDLRHAILEVSSETPPPIVVRLDETVARGLINQLQSAVDMIRSVKPEIGIAPEGMSSKALVE